MADQGLPGTDSPGTNTNWSNNLLMASAGLAQKPGCTLEVCTMVLRVAVSHLKREARSSLAIGPPAVSPFDIFSKARR